MGRAREFPSGGRRPVAASCGHLLPRGLQKLEECRHGWLVAVVDCWVEKIHHLLVLLTSKNEMYFETKTNGTSVRAKGWSGIMNMSVGFLLQVLLILLIIFSPSLLFPWTMALILLFCWAVLHTSWHSVFPGSHNPKSLWNVPPAICLSVLQLPAFAGHSGINSSSNRCNSLTNNKLENSSLASMYLVCLVRGLTKIHEISVDHTTRYYWSTEWSQY